MYPLTLHSNSPTLFEDTQVTVASPPLELPNIFLSFIVNESEFQRVTPSTFHVKVLGGGLEAM